MKKLALLSLTFALLMQVYGQEQTEPLIIKQMLLSPHPEKVVEFKKNLAEHNKKFHSEGAHDVLVYEIMTGKDTGKFIWLMGPGSWEDMENIPSDSERQAHWDSKVASTLQSHPKTQIWELDPERSSFNHEMAHKYVRVRFFEIPYSERQPFESVEENLTAVIAKYFPENVRGYYSRLFAYDNFNIAIADFRTSYVNNSFPGMERLTEAYKELHGEDFMERQNDYLNTIKDMKMEIWKFNEELSTQSAKILAGG